MDKTELKQQARILQSKLLELSAVKNRLEEALNHVRAACPHEAKPLPHSGIVVCEVCGVRLEGCLASLDGECHYDQDSDTCIFCYQEKHAVQVAPR